VGGVTELGSGRRESSAPPAVSAPPAEIRPQLDPTCPISAATVRRVPFALRTVFGLTSLVISANLLGGLVITFLILAVNSAAPEDERTFLLVAAATYVAVSIAAGCALAVLLQRRTLHWFAKDVTPIKAEARRALRMPVDLAVITGVLWLIGAVLMSGLAAGVGATVGETFDIGGGLLLAGVSVAAVTYLVAARASRPITARALAAHPPPHDTVMLGVRSRLLLIWSLTTGVPLVGIAFILAAPPGQSHVRGAGIFAAVVALAVGVVSTGLAARAIGTPLRDLLVVLRRVGDGDLDLQVPVEDAGEIGLLQSGINDMVAGLRERDRISDLFGRHVGPAVAREAVIRGVTLSGETRDVVALFVDIAGSTQLTTQTEPAEFVAMLNRFFEIVVEVVEASGGLLNKFEGDAALCVFGAPVELDDPATAALRSAREIRERVAAVGEVDVGIGVAAGPVIAGQVGAASRLEYTVIGDAVNEAARLTELAKAERGGLLASDAVVQRSTPTERANWTAGAEIVLRGRSTPTRTWAG
jgi:class 3 adenylate cyclase